MSCDVQDSKSSDATCEEAKKGLNLSCYLQKALKSHSHLHTLKSST